MQQVGALAVAAPAAPPRVLPSTPRVSSSNGRAAALKCRANNPNSNYYNDRGGGGGGYGNGNANGGGYGASPLPQQRTPQRRQQQQQQYGGPGPSQPPPSQYYQNAVRSGSYCSPRHRMPCN